MCRERYTAIWMGLHAFHESAYAGKESGGQIRTIWNVYYEAPDGAHTHFEIEAALPVGFEMEVPDPQKQAFLFQIYPNPFHHAMTITYHLSFGRSRSFYTSPRMTFTCPGRPIPGLQEPPAWDRAEMSSFSWIGVKLFGYHVSVCSGDRRGGFVRHRDPEFHHQLLPHGNG